MPEEDAQLDAVNQLYNMLVSSRDARKSSLLPSNISYVLYARKSTVGEGRQEKSIDDQISDCFDRVIKPDKITLGSEDIIKEQGSAKEPDIRPKFKTMIDDIKRGKYNGIVAWHPDRLARNMKEAGEIIDLLDKNIIKDLKFATSTFENNPTGKMLLGISFVLSKQYSEHLSETVQRGNRRQTEERGRFLGHLLHGYYISNDDRLYPDGENFLIIKEAFQMRVRGAQQKEIVKYLNSQGGYTRIRRGGAPKPYVWDKDAVSKMLKNPTYAGILVYGDSIANLVDAYGFEPVISVPEFLTINKAKDFTPGAFQSTAKIKQPKVKFLNRMVICGHCGKSMTASITTKKTGSYFRFRCETVDCEFKGSGPRAKVLIDFALNWLDDHRFTTKENYDNYIQEVRLQSRVRSKEIVNSMRQTQAAITAKQAQYEATKRAVVNNDKDIARHYIGDLERYESELNDLRNAYEHLVTEKEGLSSAIVSYENYLKLFENVANLLRSVKSFGKLDDMLRKFYSNFVVKGYYVPPNNKITRWEVTDFKLNEPYKGFIESGIFENFRTWSG